MHRHLVLTLLVTPTLLAGCSASGTSTRSAAATGGDATAAGSGAARPAGPAVVSAALSADQRSVVRTASITVTVRDASAAADRATALATSLGGLVQQDTRSRDGRGTASLVLRIPPRRLGESLTAVAGLGRETSRQMQARDVTDQAVDLGSRLATQRASVARVRVLLARAGSVTEISTIERELTSREADLESLQHRANALTGQVDLGTLELTLRGAAATTAASTGGAGFTDGLRSGWHAVAAITRVAAVALGALLPFSPLLLALAAGLIWRRRRTTAT